MAEKFVLMADGLFVFRTRNSHSGGQSVGGTKATLKGELVLVHQVQLNKHCIRRGRLPNYRQNLWAPIKETPNECATGRP